ncbi:MAG TPA: S41 family peptidase [Cytophagaceae bacterium]|jgi:hypothetical protein
MLIKRILLQFFIIHVLLSYAFSQKKVTKLSEVEIHTLIKNTGQALQKYYVFPEKANVMNEYLHSRHKSGSYNRLNSIKELTDLVQQDLQKICPDPHLHIFYDPKMAVQLEKSSSTKDQENGINATRAFPKINFDLVFTKLELLHSNMVYLRLDDFSNFVSAAKPALNATFKWLRNCDILFIDLRYNSGGSPEMVSQLESYFFKEKTRMNDIVDRIQNKTIEMYADPLMADSIHVDMPVYILTSKNTFSAAEDFSYGMQTSKRAIIIGETTGGGAHPTEVFSVGQGFVTAIPYARSYNNITKTDWEGTGVIPDVPVPSEEALLQARKLAFNYLSNQVSNERQKRMLQWRLNDLSIGLKTPDNILRQFAGNYSGLDFFVREGEFYCKNAGRGDNIFKLRHVKDTIFVLDEGVQIQFEKDSRGEYSMLKMLWSDGEISEKSKW